MSVHAFVDETKARGFVMVAAILEPRDLAVARSTMRGLCLRGQPRLHFQKERSSRGTEIAAAISRIPVRPEIYDASAIPDHREARTACLSRLAADLMMLGAQRLVLEQDDSLVQADRADLYRSLYGLNDVTLTYVPARLEPLLWIPDAAAWCWTHGAGWQGRIHARIGEVRRL